MIEDIGPLYEELGLFGRGASDEAVYRSGLRRQAQLISAVRFNVDGNEAINSPMRL